MRVYEEHPEAGVGVFVSRGPSKYKACGKKHYSILGSFLRVL